MPSDKPSVHAVMFVGSTLWVGTAGGLNRVEQSDLSHSSGRIFSEDGLRDNICLSLAASGNGLATARGIGGRGSAAGGKATGSMRLAGCSNGGGADASSAGCSNPAASRRASVAICGLRQPSQASSNSASMASALSGRPVCIRRHPGSGGWSFPRPVGGQP